MTSTATTATGHPIVEFTDRLRRRLGELVEAPVWSMTPDEQRAVLVELRKAGSQLEALRLRVLAGGDKADIAADSAATSTGAWLAHATTQPRGKAHADVKLAVALDDNYALTRDALAAAHVDGEQARVIAAAVDRLREEAADAVAADPTIPERAEKHLITLAADYDDKALKALGKHVLEILDPDAADTALGKKLDAQEQAAARKTYFELFNNGDGTFSGRFTIPELHGNLLMAALQALTAPNRLSRNKAGEVVHDPTVEGDEKTIPYPERLGLGFTELIEHLPTEASGGFSRSGTTVLVHLDYQHLLDGLGSARLDTGVQVSAGTARRLACSAGIVPAVLGGRSDVLDVGREQRLHNTAMRRALSVSHDTCATQGCERPFAWCEVHHPHAWASGGSTSLANGIPLCGFHHRRAHDPAFTLDRMPDGDVRFRRRR